MFRKVVEFNEKVLGITDRSKGMVSDAERFALERFIDEEVKEFTDAHRNKDFIGAVDAMLDTVYFAIGGLHKLGLSPKEMEECFAAVHVCNMTKSKGRKAERADLTSEDAVKPEAWIGPEQRIAEILSRRRR